MEAPRCMPLSVLYLKTSGAWLAAYLKATDLECDVDIGASSVPPFLVNSSLSRVRSCMPRHSTTSCVKPSGSICAATARSFLSASAR